MRRARVVLDHAGEPGSDAEIRIAGAAHHQLAHVYRLRPGDEALGVTAGGRELLLEILAVGPRQVRARVRDVRPPAVEAATAVTLAVAPPRGPRMDWLVEKAGELGAAAVQPVLSERGILPPEAVAQRGERWLRMAAAATAQSRRGLRTQVLTASRLEDVVGDFAGPALVAHPGGGSLQAALLGLRGAPRLLLAVGPEGGFAPSEAAAAVDRGAVAVGLGPRILRVETAALAMLAVSMALLGEWEPRG